MKINGQTIVLITGASSGIGKALALEFGRRKSTVLLIARNSSALNAVADQIHALGGRAKTYAVDLSSAEATEEMCDLIKRECGAPDILVNNAGSGSWKFVHETTDAELESLMQVPVMAAFRMARAFVPVMKKSEPTRIVTMTSFAAYIAFPGAAAYIISRRAMLALHHVLQEEVVGSKIKCSIAYFSKVQSEYWSHNVGSEDRLPTSHRLIRTLTSGEAATAIVRGIVRDRSTIYAPPILWLFTQATRWTPRLVRSILRATSYKGSNEHP